MVTQSAAALAILDDPNKIDTALASTEEPETTLVEAFFNRQLRFDVALGRPVASALTSAKKVDKAVVVTFIPPFRSETGV